MKPLASAAVLALASLVPACGSPEREPSSAPPAPAPAPVAAPVPVPVAVPAQEPGRLELATCGKISRVHALGDLYLASMPTAADLEEARAMGVKTVVNLRRPAEHADFDEAAAVAALGLVYVNLPISGASDLTDEVIEQAREFLNRAERPLLLHCASANRVGAVWIPWRVLDGGIDLDEAVAEARTIGLKTPELEAKARDYVRRKQAAH